MFLETDTLPDDTRDVICIPRGLDIGNHAIDVVTDEVDLVLDAEVVLGQDAEIFSHLRLDVACQGL